MNLSETNKEGLTFIEWMCAAGLGDVFVVNITAEHVKDWRDGVCPSEYLIGGLVAP